MRHNSSQPNAYAPGQQAAAPTLAQMNADPALNQSSNGRFMRGLLTKLGVGPHSNAAPGQQPGVQAPVSAQPAQGQMSDQQRRQMMAQMLMSRPFQNPQMVQPQFQQYS